jgi:hypothetical protein
LQIEGGQTNLTDFFEGSLGSGTFAPRRKVTHKSKRLSKAMANLRRQNAEDDDEDVQEIAPRQMASKRKRKPVDVVKVESDDEERELGKETSSEEEEESSSDDDNVRRMQGERSGSKKRVNKGKGTSKANKKSRGKRVKA